jgi:plastocyanin
MQKTLALIVLGSLVLACSDSDTPSSTDAGKPANDGSASLVDAGDAGTDSAAASGACTDALLDADDHTANGADVTFPGFLPDASIAPAQFTPHCIRIKAGQTVGFFGSFADHPLANEGEAGTPIPKLTDTGTELKVKFPASGKFGFHCDFHPSIMFGTVKVVP